jgi:hypothetical protein
MLPEDKSGPDMTLIIGGIKGLPKMIDGIAGL